MDESPPLVVTSRKPNSAGAIWDPLCQLPTFATRSKKARVGSARCVSLKFENNMYVRCDNKCAYGGVFCFVDSHRLDTCEKVLAIEGAPVLFVKQCDRLQDSEEPVVYASIVDTLHSKVVAPCFAAVKAADQEEAFENCADDSEFLALRETCSSFLDSR